MSMSMNIVGFRPPDKRWKEMAEIYESCVNAQIKVPEEVVNFFNGEVPDESGVEIGLRKHPAVEEWASDMREGFQVDLTKLPKDIRYIRFYNSY